MITIIFVVAHNSMARNNKLSEGFIMSTGGIIGIIIAVLAVCCCFTHRRVIKALIKHEPMPKAPKWHCWVKKENRRG